VINGKVFDMDRVDFTVKRGTTETWLIKSSDPTGVKHNFHLHLVQFRVLERGGGPPHPSDAGPKDTIPITAGGEDRSPGPSDRVALTRLPELRT
jgi:spore coat protein A